MKKCTLSTIFVLMFFAACKKDNDEKNNPIETSRVSQFPTKPGSYWVYQWYSIDRNNIETTMAVTDSVFIVGDTVINQKKYATYLKSFWGTPYLSFERDSVGYVVDVNGTVLYSYTNFTDQFGAGSEPGIWDYYSKMVNSPSKTVVPAGSFSTIARRTFYYKPSGGSLNNCGDTSFTLETHYSSSIGVIKTSEVSFLDFQAMCKKTERRLVRYSIP